MALRACLTCGAAFTPRHARVRHCTTHELHGRAHRSPTTRAQDAEYRRAREVVLHRDASHPCPLCGEPGGLTSIDHIVAVSRGGTHDLENLQAVHPWCNARKGDR